jgi:hypothetical protein
MVTYEITATVAPRLADEYERYMRERHVPDLLATGCFVGAALTRSTPGRYRIRYEAPDQTTLDRYLAEHAPRLRAHALERFPDGVELSREVWTAVEVWSARSDARA